MTKFLAVFAIVTGLLVPGNALADDDCFVPMVDWQPRASVSQLAHEKGWTVRRIRIDDGCYQIIGQDAQGSDLEVTLHPATLAILELEFEDGASIDADDGREMRSGD